VTAERPTDGKSIFTTTCGSCHTLADAGAAGTVGPNLDDAKPSKDLVVDRVTNGKGQMPSFEGTLDEAQIQAVADYVSSSAGK
jgi:mono/diheme cytochrome c family protein